MNPITILLSLSILLISCSKSTLDTQADDNLNSKQEEISTTIQTKAISSVDSSLKRYPIQKDYWTEMGVSAQYLKTIINGTDKLEACQLPDSILSKIPTDKLVEICITFPLRFDFLLSNNEDDAMDFYIENFNALNELSKRNDANSNLIHYYSLIDSYDAKAQLDEAFIERLLLNKSFSKDLISDIKLANQLNSIIDSKIRKRLIYDVRSLMPLSRKNNLQKNINTYKTSNGTETVNIQSADERYGANNVTVLTPFGKPISGFYNGELLPELLDEYTQIVLEQYPSAQILDTATARYNCHAYAWAERKDIWINEKPESSGLRTIASYTINDLYFESTDNIRKIFYYQGDHSAIRQKGYSNDIYISKWGRWPLVRHHKNNVPPDFKPNYQQYFSAPYIIGEDEIYLDETIYTYTIYPYMSYATYVWSLPDQRETHYEIISSSNNELQIRFKQMGIYDIYCDILNSNGDIVYTDFIEVLVEN